MSSEGTTQQAPPLIAQDSTGSMSKLEEQKSVDPQEEDDFKKFMEAIRGADLERFQELLDKYNHFANKIEAITRQPPQFAAVQVQDREKALEFLKRLSEKNADLGYKDGLKQSIMFYACREGKLQIVEFLHEKGCNSNDVDLYTQTPLYYAGREGHIETCEKLLEWGADPNHTDINSQTCLFYAAKAGQLEACKFLIDNGAKHDYTDTKRQTALYWARKSGNQALIDYLTALKQNKPLKKKNTATGKGGAGTGKTLLADPAAQGDQIQSVNTKRKRDKDHIKVPYRLMYYDDNGNKVEMNLANFEIFKQNYPKVAAMLTSEEKLQEAEAELKEKESWIKVAKKIIQSLWKIRGCFNFHQPVDPVALHCFDYRDIVKRPMDLGTIKNKLSHSQYEHPKGFLEDMQLVFNNCYNYNGKESEIGRIAINIENEYNRLYKELNFEDIMKEYDRLLERKQKEQEEAEKREAENPAPQQQQQQIAQPATDSQVQQQMSQEAQNQQIQPEEQPKSKSEKIEEKTEVKDEIKAEEVQQQPQPEPEAEQEVKEEVQQNEIQQEQQQEQQQQPIVDEGEPQQNQEQAEEKPQEEQQHEQEQQPPINEGIQQEEQQQQQEQPQVEVEQQNAEENKPIDQE